MNFIEKLKEKGILCPIVMATESIRTYPDIYSGRGEEGLLSGLEPNFLDEESLKTYIKPWKYIVGMAMPYNLLPINPLPQPNEISSISLMAWEWDYHRGIKTLIEEALGSSYIYQIHVDQGPLPERHIAVKMGIAMAGRSQMLVHSEYGTAFHLAFIMTNFEKRDEEPVGFHEATDLTDSTELTNLAKSNNPSNISNISSGNNRPFELSPACKGCNKCQRHCPGKALTGEADFDANKCISALTQKKGMLSETEMKAIGRQLYGCDLCQLACPTNSPLSKRKYNLLPNRVRMNRVDPLTILKASQKNFVRDFGEMGFSWRGLGVSKRNAIINIGNYGNLGYLEELERAKGDWEHSGNEILTKTADWAIHQIKEHHHRKGSENERLKSTAGN